MITATIPTTLCAADRRVRVFAEHLYDAECALHQARQTHVDVWIAAAAEKLHQAVAAYLAAMAAPTG
jgi:hypothetical protein